MSLSKSLFRIGNLREVQIHLKSNKFILTRSLTSTNSNNQKFDTNKSGSSSGENKRSLWIALAAIGIGSTFIYFFQTRWDLSWIKDAQKRITSSTKALLAKEKEENDDKPVNKEP